MKAFLQNNVGVSTALLSDPDNWLCGKVTNQQYGHHMVAKIDIKKGSLIGYDKPIFRLSMDPNECVECQAELTDAAVGCAGHNNHNGIYKEGHPCCLQRYCSVACQQWAWEHYHQAQNPRVIKCDKVNRSSASTTESSTIGDVVTSRVDGRMSSSDKRLGRERDVESKCPEPSVLGIRRSL